MKMFSLEGLKKELRDHLKSLESEASQVRAALEALEGTQEHKVEERKTATPPKKREKRERRVRSYRELILKCLADYEIVSSRDVVQLDSNASATSASRELNRMCNEGLIKLEKVEGLRKFYSVPLKEEVVDKGKGEVVSLHLSTAGFSKQEQKLLSEGERKLVFTTEQPA